MKKPAERRVLSFPGSDAFWFRETGMKTRLSLAPGQNGTKRLLAQFGERLVRVRYRYDSKRKVRFKTVELIVETVPWTPWFRASRMQAETRVTLRIAFDETDLRRRIASAGGIRIAERKVWEIAWGKVAATLGEAGGGGGRGAIQVAVCADICLASWFC